MFSNFLTLFPVFIVHALPLLSDAKYVSKISDFYIKILVILLLQNGLVQQFQDDK